MILNPYEPYRYSLKRGMIGTDVAGLQLNFADLTPDGWFGKRTENRIKEFQEDQGIEPLGIVGPITNSKIVEVRSRKAQQNYGLLPGTLKSVANKESNRTVYASSKHPSDSGIDVGAYMMSSGDSQGTQQFYTYAYTINKVAPDVANRIKTAHEDTPDNIVPSQYLNDLAEGDEDKFRWQMAMLNHNWPHAAHDIPRKGFIYDDHDRDDQPSEWIMLATAGRLETPREWVYDYVLDSTVYIKWS